MSNRKHATRTKQAKKGISTKRAAATTTAAAAATAANRHHHHSHRQRHRTNSPGTGSRHSSRSTTPPSPTGSGTASAASMPMASSENPLANSNLSAATTTTTASGNIMTISSGYGTSVPIPPSSTVNPAAKQFAGAPKMGAANVPTDPQRSSAAHQQLQQQVAATSGQQQQAAALMADQLHEDYKLLLSPMFSAMTKITDNLFLTGVGGMTRENFRRNHIDFVINITTDAPLWDDSVESWRLPLEDDTGTNILAHLDIAADRIHEAIARRNAHVLVHCVAGVSRSATVVISYLMKYKRMDLRCAFNHCYNLRPVVRPNNGFMVQLIEYESQLFGRTSVRMVEADVDGTLISVPNFFIDEHPKLVLLEVMRVRDAASKQAAAMAAPAATTTTTTTNTNTTSTTAATATNNTVATTNADD